jgi:5'-3' exonuclease
VRQQGQGHQIKQELTKASDLKVLGKRNRDATKKEEIKKVAPVQVNRQTSGLSDVFGDSSSSDEEETANQDSKPTTPPEEEEEEEDEEPPPPPPPPMEEDADENEWQDGPDDSRISSIEVIEDDSPEVKAEWKALLKAKQEEELEKYREEVQDHVRLGEEGWKDRYYNDKLKMEDIEHGGGREEVYRTYTQGLCWVMKYYYEGVASWKWFYPFHYGPFASDLMNMDR